MTELDDFLYRHDDDLPPERDRGCLFPDRCCMPGDHTSDECHTAEMMEQYEQEQEQTRLPVSVPFALYTPPDVEECANDWGANCGPASLAALAGISLAKIKPYLVGFAGRGYMNPTHMRDACLKMNLPVARQTKHWPTVNDVALVFVQWGGPWLKPGVPVGAAYRNTHWITLVGEAAYDVNVGRWVHRADWCDPRDGVAAEIMKHVPRCDGTWTVRTAMHFSPADIKALRARISGN